MVKKESHHKEKSNELEELKIGWQRCQADFENFKKRTAAEKQIWQEQAKKDFLHSMLPILDNLSLMSKSTPLEISDNPWVQGVVLITKQIDDALSEMNVEKIEPEIGVEFDHNFHEAISSEFSDKIEPNHILKIVKPGYKIHDQIVRPAVVVVSTRDKS